MIVTYQAQNAPVIFEKKWQALFLCQNPGERGHSASVILKNLKNLKDKVTLHGLQSVINERLFKDYLIERSIAAH